MPREYENCRDNMIKNGASPEKAKRVCAISYFKRHGKTPQQDEKAAQHGMEECMKAKVSGGMMKDKAHEECMKKMFPEGKASFETDEIELFDMVEAIGGVISHLKV